MTAYTEITPPSIIFNGLIDRALPYDTEMQLPFADRARMNIQRVLLAPEIAEAVTAEERLLQAKIEGPLFDTSDTNGRLGARLRISPLEMHLLKQTPMGGSTDEAQEGSYTAELMNVLPVFGPNYQATAMMNASPDGTLDTKPHRMTISDSVARMSEEDVRELLVRLTQHMLGADSVEVHMVNVSGQGNIVNLQPRLVVELSANTPTTINLGLLPHILDGMYVDIRIAEGIEAPIFVERQGSLVVKSLQLDPRNERSLTHIQPQGLTSAVAVGDRSISE